MKAGGISFIARDSHRLRFLLGKLSRLRIAVAAILVDAERVCVVVVVEGVLQLMRRLFGHQISQL